MLVASRSSRAARRIECGARLGPLLLLLLAACGRTTLRTGPGAGAGGTASTGDPGGDAGTDAPPPPPPPCFLSLAGPAQELIAFPEGDADSPQMVVIDPGDASGPRPAVIAYEAVSEDANFWHPELRLAALQIDPPWPDGAHIVEAPVLAGVDAHAWGKIAAAPGSGGGIALAWYQGDLAVGAPSGFKFRTFDTATWSPGADVFLDPAGSVAYGFQPGAGIRPSGDDYGGDGYAVSWRGGLDNGNAAPRVAVIDTAGAVRIGPLEPAAPQPYPGRSSDVAWTGSTYLVATAFDVCGPGDAPCTPGSVVVARIRPAVGDKGGILEAASSIAVLEPGTAPRRPLLASRDGFTWLAWSESLPGDDAAPRTFRIARLDPAGGPVSGAEAIVASGVLPTAGLSIAVTPVGVLVMWGEDADPAAPLESPEHSRLLVQRWSLEGESMGPPLVIQTPNFAYNPTPSAVALAYPRSVVVSWAAAQEATAPRDVTYIARLDCSETP